LSCAFIPQGSRFLTKQLDTGPATQIVIQVDSGILLSHDQQQELLHQAVVGFFDQNAAQLNHLLRAVSRGGIEPINLLAEDYARIAERNQRDADLPGDCADLTLVTVSERLDVAEILSLDSDVDVYRRFRHKPFCRVSLP
jgi:hypothetical protein